MGIVVQFDYCAWTARYPEFASIPETTASAYFAEATIYNRNDGGGPVNDAGVQSALLNMLTAHIAQLYSAVSNQAQSQLVGRISSANQGPATIQVDNDYPSGTPQWFQQTKYGSSWWAATAPYRTMRYRVGAAGYGGRRG